MGTEKFISKYTLTDDIVNLVAEMTKLLGQVPSKIHTNKYQEICTDGRIRMMYASLSYDYPNMSSEQMKGVIEGRRQGTSERELHDIINIVKVYNKLYQYQPYSLTDMLLAHKEMMDHVAGDAGAFRNCEGGVFAGKKLIHMAPAAKEVPSLVKKLLWWVQTEEVHPLIKSCILRYEMEFLHPFTEGNDRMARLWQTVILYHYHPVFSYLPIDMFLSKKEYYKVLGECDQSQDSGIYIAMMLRAIKAALVEILQLMGPVKREDKEDKEVSKALIEQAVAQKEAQIRAEMAKELKDQENTLTARLEGKAAAREDRLKKEWQEETKRREEELRGKMQLEAKLREDWIRQELTKASLEREAVLRQTLEAEYQIRYQMNDDMEEETTDYGRRNHRCK